MSKGGDITNRVRRVFSLSFILIFMSVNFFASSVVSAAPSAGLLRGKMPSISGPGTVGYSNVHFVTDGNESSSATISELYSFTYKLNGNYTIDGYYLRSESGFVQMRLLDANNISLGVYPISGKTIGTSYKEITPVDNVFKVELFSPSGSGQDYVFQLDVREGKAPPPDTTPPLVPTGLSATVLNETDISLTWNKNSDKTVGYRIYMNGSRHNSSLIAGTSYKITGLKPGTYTFEVTSVDAAGNESAKSSSVSKTLEAPPPPPDTTPPAVPVLSGKPGKGQAVLTWTKSSDSDLAGYKLYQDGKLVGTYITNSAEITGLKNGKEYIFQVSAIDLSGNESEKSNKVAITPIDKLIVNLVPNGDSIVVQMSNGKAPYKIDWGLAIKTVDQTQYQIEGLQFKTDYTVTVTDANGLVYTQTINTGDTKGYVPPTFPNPQELFQKMLNAFGTAGTISVAIIGGAIALGILCVLAMWAFRLLKRWLSQAK